MTQFLIWCLAFVAISYGYEYEEKWFSGMPIDHFSFTSNKTFQMRYLINKSHWKNGAPIFFYCGNEGDITLFAANSGFMWDLAPDFRAMVVFAEHRFYGKTLPFGNASYTAPSNLGYLTSEQALADYAVFLTWLKKEVTGASKSPVIAFGGSYGGMLAAWMRQKYPNVILGSLAASAPVLQFTTSCETYNTIVARTFQKSGGSNCVKSIRASFDAIDRLGATKPGLDFLNSNFRFCPESKLNKSEDLGTFKDYLIETWGTVVMIDYPYATNFLNPVPAWPVREICKRLKGAENADDQKLLLKIDNALSVYQNYTGSKKCLSFATSTDQLGDSGWNFQACTEMVMPMCNKGILFPESEWNFDQFAKGCHDSYGVTTQKDWAAINYWDRDLRGASNIIFSNGDLDPWSGGGVTSLPAEAEKRGLYTIMIKNGAHHYDLRGANPNDTKDVLKARNQEKSIIKGWIASYYTSLHY